ncbi:MAG: caspase family protein [Paludibacteraceae bacterium]|nr:caspase family protein [Paludibacteraceae bacterium]
MRNKWFSLAFLTLLCAVPSAAQNHHEAVSQTVRLKVENKEQLQKKLQMENKINQMKWQAELDKERNSLADDRKISEDVKVTVTPKVAIDTTETGDEEMNLNVTFSYETMPSSTRIKVGNQTDDYPAGAYLMLSSNACRLTCDFLKGKIEGDLQKYFTPGRMITVKITGATDGSPVTGKIPYGGEYGDFKNKMMYLNGKLSGLTVTEQTGITSNAQLAFLRTQGVEDFIKNFIDPMAFTKNRFQIFAVENEQKGSQYRRIDVELIIHGAYNEELSNVQEKKAEEQVQTVPDVDENIPQSTEVDEDVIALVIANENYDKSSGLIANVPFSQNDGKVFCEYLKKTLGVPSEQVKYLSDATYNQMQSGFDWLEKTAKAWNGKAKVIVYYSGHGMPIVSSNSTYLVPVDANPTRPEQMCELKKLYSTLSALPTQSAVCFLDACFCGTQRNGKMMLEGTRGVAIKVSQEDVTGNVVVFSATGEMQSAHPYKEQQHGLFTYYLLKKIKESSGNVSLGDLFQSVKSNVEKKASLNSWEQTPTVTSSTRSEINWENNKLH